MSGLQIHGRVQVDITDDDHNSLLLLNILINLKKCWQKVSKKQEIEDFY